MRGWIRRVTRVHAGLLHAARLFSDAKRAGGGPAADEHRARAARGDRTLLQEFLTVALEQIAAIRDDVEREIEQQAPTAARPGTPEKLNEMRARVERGEGIFHEQDGRVG